MKFHFAPENVWPYGTNQSTWEKHGYNMCHYIDKKYFDWLVAMLNDPEHRDKNLSGIKYDNLPTPTLVKKQQ